MPSVSGTPSFWVYKMVFVMKSAALRTDASSGTPKEVFSQTEKVRSLHLDVPQAAELRDELVKAGIPMPEGIIDTGACAQALYELLQ